MVTATCSHCQYSTEVHDSLAGRRARCPQCKGVFLIPGTGQEGGAPVPPFPSVGKENGAKVIEAICSECGFTKPVPASYEGRKAKCPNCARVIQIAKRPPDTTTETTLFVCPHCDTKRTVKAEYSGKKVRCPHCGQPSILGGKEGDTSQVKVVEPMDDLTSTSNDQAGKERRRAERIPVNDFGISMGVIGIYPLKDVDEFGFGFDTIDSDWEFKRNQIINFDITCGDRLVLARLQARVTRINYGSVGCVFVDINPEQFRTLQQEMQNSKISLQHEHGDNPLKTLLLNLHKSGQLENL